MGGGAKSKSTSTSGSAQAWAQPYALQGASDVQGVFNQQQPGLNRLTQTVQGTILPELVNRFQAGGANVAAARNNIADVLSGKYLNNSPYLNQIIRATNRDVTNGVNSQFEQAGRYGSDAHGNGLATALANNEANLRYGDYNNQLARMDQASALGLQGGLSDVAQALAAAGTGAEIPFAGSSSLANSLGALFNGGTQTSIQKGPNPIWGALGAGLGAAGMALSDRRMKADIELLGDWDSKGDGLKRYAFRYKWEKPGTRHEGVMADEVKALRPNAYVPNYRGTEYDGVNYAAL
jgi:hypothetical protein